MSNLTGLLEQYAFLSSILLPSCAGRVTRYKRSSYHSVCAGTDGFHRTDGVFGVSLWPLR